MSESQSQMIDVSRELLAYNEKIALAKLEVAKAEERVKEIEFQKSRFELEVYIEMQKQQQGKNNQTNGS